MPATDKGDLLQNFKAFNSTTLTSTVTMNRAFSATSGHIEFLIEMWAWLERLQSNRPRMLPCVKGWKMAITCLEYLTDQGRCHVLKVEDGDHMLVTSDIQQLDQGIISSFKRHYRRELLKQMVLSDQVSERILPEGQVFSGCESVGDGECPDDRALLDGATRPSMT